MVLILAGSFEMGDHFNEGKNNELPVHTVELDVFHMDMTEVPVGQYSSSLYNKVDMTILSNYELM